MAVVAYINLTYTLDVRDKVLHLVQNAVAVVKGQDGFQDLNAYHCQDDTAWHLFITWESQEHHDACQRSPQWIMLMPVLSELMEDESLQLKLRFCESL